MLRALTVSFAMLAVVAGPCAAQLAPRAVEVRNNDIHSKQPTPHSNSAAGSSSGEDSAAENELLEAANKSRELAGVSPLRMDESLREAAKAHALLGVAETHYLELPAAELDGVAHADLNAAIGSLIDNIKPVTLFMPFLGDIHLDHQLVFRSVMVAARPRALHYPPRLLAYETLSETNWSAPYLEPHFQPHLFIDIAETLERKIAAFQCFESQCRSFPDERSPEALRALAQLRGATVRRHAAEAFVVIREVI